MKSIVSDFDKVANMNKLDIAYLKQLGANFTGPKMRLVDIDQKYNPQEFLNLDVI
jgi:hypothetical protein